MGSWKLERDWGTNAFIFYLLKTFLFELWYGREECWAKPRLEEKGEAYSFSWFLYSTGADK